MGALSLGYETIRSVIVDDDPSIGEVVKELISKENVSSVVFSDSQRAVEYLAREPVDIVITDLMMGNVGGLEVLRCAKQTNADSVVIIITGHASLETAIDAVREGAYDYIKKPFKLREMELAFDKAVEKVRLVQKNQALVQELKVTRAELFSLRKENEENKQLEEEKKSHRTPIHFYSASTPNIEFFQTASESKTDLYQRLDKIAKLKKEGFLTDQEFLSIKEHILKSLKRFGA